MLYPPSADDTTLDGLVTNLRCALVRAGWFPCEPHWHHPRKALPHYTALLCVAGGADYLVGETPYRLEPGGVLLLPPHVLREGHHHDPANPLRIYVVHFFARLYGVLDLSAVYRLPVLLRPAREQLALLMHTAGRIVGELAAAQPGYGLAANSDCAYLVALLWRAAGASGGEGVLPGARPVAEVVRLAPVFRLVQARYRERLSLKELAAAVHLHPAYFSTLFKRTTGLPPLRYVERYRLERVRELLVTTDLSIAEIAATTGYHDPFYLSRVFHRAEGVSPTDYRKAKKQLAFP